MGHLRLLIHRLFRHPDGFDPGPGTLRRLPGRGEAWRLPSAGGRGSPGEGTGAEQRIVAAHPEGAGGSGRSRSSRPAPAR